MKKQTKILALLAFCAVLFSACHSAKSCPAYSKAPKPVPEKNA